MGRSYEQLVAAASHAQLGGRLEEAFELAKQALEAKSDGLDALYILGAIGVKKDDSDLAIESFQRIAQLETESFDAHFWLSVMFRKQSKYEEAAQAAGHAVAARPTNAKAQNELGISYLALNRREEAESCFNAACHLAPNAAIHFENLGRALQALEKNREAVQAFRHAIAIGGQKTTLLYRLGEALADTDQFDEAGACAKKILAQEPSSVQGNILLAIALIGRDQVKEAAQYAERAVELAPTDARAAAYYGRTLQSLGKIEDANLQFAHSIELEPRQGSAYHALVHNRRLTTEDSSLVDKMASLAHDEGLPKREIVQLEYALGKACEDLGDYVGAMSHFDKANRIDHELKVGVAPFRPAELEKSANFLIKTFTAGFIEAARNLGLETDRPIFVVGMMRSGTTLAEQILSSHREVGGAGEQLFWPQHLGHGEKIFRLGKSNELDGEELRNLSLKYLEILKLLAPGKNRVVDKMNTNYLLLGLVHIAYPNARIIHMRRHPVDTCLSIWATPVANQIDLCGSKDNIVFMYRQYLRVMKHWRSVLPQNRFLDVQYEALVVEREPQTRKMVEFLGLEWDEACLSPEQNERSVKTPSVWQVRQPVYKTSVARWRKYESCLGAFAELFKDQD